MYSAPDLGGTQGVAPTKVGPPPCSCV